MQYIIGFVHAVFTVLAAVAAAGVGFFAIAVIAFFFLVLVDEYQNRKIINDRKKDN